MNEPHRRRFAPGLWIVASSTLLSRILGMIRDTVTANLFGVSPVTDALWLAFKVPNLARRLFGEGALTAAFLPAFTRELHAGSDALPESARQLSGAVFSILAATLSAIVFVGEVGLVLGWWLVDDPQTKLLLGLTAVMLPYALLICLAAQLTAVLHALGRFTVPSLVPVLLNLFWIASIWVVDPLFEPDREAQAYALAVCVVSAGAVQLALQWRYVAWLGMHLHARWRENWPRAREVFLAMLPVMFGLSIEQINALVDGLIAWGFSAPPSGEPLPWPGHPAYPLQAGAVSALYFGERMYQFPLGVFGIALGTVLFPLFARHAARGDIARLRDDLSLGLRLVIAVGLPASAGLMAVSFPLTRVLFEHGEFTAADSERTAAVIAAYGTGVWAFCALPILYRGFYALGDRISPVRVGTWAVLGDLFFNLTLIWPLAERGLAYSTVISAALQTACLVVLLQRRVGRLDWRRFGSTAFRAALATAAMSAACHWTLERVPHETGRTGQVVGLLGGVAAAMAAYFAAAALLRLDEVWWLFARQVPQATAAAASDAERP